MKKLVAVVMVVGIASLALAGSPHEYKQHLVAHYYQDPEYWGGTWPDSQSKPNSDPMDWTFTTYSYSRLEPLINHQFIRNGWFSIRWVGYINIEPGQSGPKAQDPVEVGFELWMDDGARLFIDGSKVIDSWKACWEKDPASHRGATVTLTPGHHRIVVEYFQGQSLEKDDKDPAKLYWTIGGKQQIVPASHLFHTDEDLETR